MPKRSRQLTTLAQLFKLLGDEIRLSLVMELQEGPRNVTAMVKKLKLPQPTVSHHLALLRRGNIVIARRKGKSVFYSLNGAQGISERALRTIGKDSKGLKIGAMVFGVVKT